MWAAGSGRACRGSFFQPPFSPAHTALNCAEPIHPRCGVIRSLPRAGRDKGKTWAAKYWRLGTLLFLQKRRRAFRSRRRGALPVLRRVGFSASAYPVLLLAQRHINPRPCTGFRSIAPALCITNPPLISSSRTFESGLPVSGKRPPSTPQHAQGGHPSPFTFGGEKRGKREDSTSWKGGGC